MAKRKKRKTSKNKKKAIDPSVLRLHLRYRLREGCLILTMALSVFLMVALVSYHRADPGWSHSVAIPVVANAAGRAGAWMADFILYMVGYLAYLFPVMITFAAWIFFRHRRQSAVGQLLRWPLFILRLIGFVMVLMAGSAIVAIHSTMGMVDLPFNTGGVLGTVLANAMLPVFNDIGSTLISAAAVLIGVTLFTGLSWFQFLEQLGKRAIRWAQFCAHKLKQVDWQAMWSLLRRRDSLTEDDIPTRAEPILQAAVATPMDVSELGPPKITQRPSLDMVESEFKAPRYSSSEVMPKLSLLDQPKLDHEVGYSEEELQHKSREVELRLADFGVEAKVVAVHPGPVVTRFELQLAAGTKVSKITNLAKDLARSLSVVSVRVVEVIPGKSCIGLELPNKNREVVNMCEVLATKQYQNARSSLTLALGKDIAGHPVVVDLAKMPHLLVAGTTGSGKSVSLNSMLLSLLYKATPKQLRLIMIDPKMLELSIYEGIPHLLTPVVTDMKDASTALRWCVGEMERRYRLMASLGVRNIAGYNAKVEEAAEQGAPLLDPLQASLGDHETVPELQQLPQIVVVADEFADMMVVVGKKVETLIIRLAQKARAAGIHLILATQRPSVDVITGLIKANIPTRIAFQVSAKVDSRTILDQQGAEQLLGYGDMLYLAPGTGVPVRVHGSYVHDDEVHRVIEYLKSHSEPDYVEGVLDEMQVTDSSGFTDAAMGDDGGEHDPLYDQAVEAVVRSRKVSVSSIQRRFKIGYNRAARIVEAMEAAGVVSAMGNNGSRDVLAPEFQHE